MEEKIKEEILSLRSKMIEDIELILEMTEKKIKLLIEKEQWNNV